nr:type VI secretion protein IcmF/TssM N-terminal domain-containing protein [Dyella sp. ASV24]
MQQALTAIDAMRLLECFAPLFAYGLLIDEQAASQNLPDDEWPSVHARALALVDQGRGAAFARGKPLAEVELAAFAAVAWLDEVATRRGGWGSGVGPLQQVLFRTGSAATEFFDQLGRLGSGEDEVREVFSMALLLGFAGQYYYEQGDGGELGRIKALYCPAGTSASAVLQSLQRESVTPQPYMTPGSPVLRLPGTWMGRRLAQLVATLVVLLVFVAFVAPVFSQGVSEQAWFMGGIIVAVLGVVGWIGTLAWQSLVMMRAHTRVADSTDSGYGIGSFSAAVKDAARRLRGAILHPFRRRGRWRQLSRHPWLLFVGDSAADVRSLLQAAAASPHARELSRANETRPWHWWVFRSLVAIEPGPRLSSPHAAIGDGDAPWSKALSLLARERRKLPLDGLVICMAAQSLRESEGAVVTYADRLHRLADEATRRLQLQLPVYVVVTGLEALPGHAAFRSMLPASVFRRVLGWRHASPMRDGVLDGRLEVQADAVTERLVATALAVLATESDPHKRREAFAFLQSLQGVQRGLRTFVERLQANEAGGERRLHWQGLYVTGGSRNDAPGGDFVDDLFNRFLPADRVLARRVAPKS